MRRFACSMGPRWCLRFRPGSLPRTLTQSSPRWVLSAKRRALWRMNWICPKVAAAIADIRGDKEDIAFLERLLALQSPEEAILIVEKYYDPARMLPRSIYLLDEIFEEMK